MHSYPLIRKLSSFIDLTESENQAIESWCADPIDFSPRQTFIREGEQPHNMCIMLNGWAYLFSDTRKGGRQILGVLLPGDLGAVRAFTLREIDYSLVMLNKSTVASVSRQLFLDTLRLFPRLAEAIWWSTLVDQGIYRRWLINVGQHDAATRMANLFCELWMRGDAVGLISAGQLDVPLTQLDLGDALGITSVHVNRTLRVLREQGLATFRDKKLIIADLKALRKFSGFNADYLQLERRSDIRL